LLLIKEKFVTWQSLAWSTVQSREELIGMRILQLQRRDNVIEDIGLRVQRQREQYKEYFDAHHQIRDKNAINIEDLVLLHNTKRAEDIRTSINISFVWLGPYSVLTADHQKGYFTLSELDRTPLKESVTGNRLKLYYAWYSEAVATSYKCKMVIFLSLSLVHPREKFGSVYADLDHNIEEEEGEDEEAEGEGEGFADNVNDAAERLRSLRPRGDRIMTHMDDRVDAAEVEDAVKQVTEKEYNGPYVVIPSKKQ
jgi:hypothetical protein